MNRREASKNETRQLILKAARRLFVQKGVEQCTIRDIASAAGASPASVVVHFKSKTALLEEALNRDIEIALSELLATMPKGPDLLDRLMHLSGGFLRLYDRHRNLYRALIRDTIFEPSGDTPNITRVSDQYLQYLAVLVEEGQALGHVKPEVDPMVAAGAVFSLYLGALVMFFRTPEMSAELATATLATMTGQYLKGILTGETKCPEKNPEVKK